MFKHFMKKELKNIPKKLASILPYEDILKTSWKRLSSSSSEDVFKTSPRRLDKGEYIHLSHKSSQDVFKTNIFVLAIRLLDVFKISSRCFQDVFKAPCESISKTSSIRLQDVFKMSSKRIRDVLPKHLQGIFKTFWKHLQYMFKTCYVFIGFSTGIIRLNYLPRSRISIGHTSEKFMVSVENL